MKLTTLLAYQRSYDAMRAAELERRMLNSTEYMDALKAKSLFDLELSEHTKPIELEIK